MSRKPGARPHGQIRQSQLVTTFGPGAMLDLPNHSVLVSGLDDWMATGDEIIEPRLTAKLASILQIPAVKLYPPPPDHDDPTAPVTGVPVYQFPEWFITQDLDSDQPNPAARSRMLVHRSRLSKGNKYVDRDKKKRPVVPVCFVRACRAGHIADIDWYAFVHGGSSDCSTQFRQLWMDERGTSGDLSEVWIRCDCGKNRSMAQAALLQSRALGNCNGSRPWLGRYTNESCGEPSRLLIRNASNAYFSQKLTVISLPDRDDTVKRAVDAAWENLEAVESIDDLKYERRKAKVKAALENISDEEVLSEIRARRNSDTAELKKVKQAELGFNGILGGWWHSGSTGEGELGVMECEESEFEVIVSSIAVGSSLEYSDLVVGAFQRAGGDRVVVPIQEARAMSTQGVARAMQSWS